jgi:hypothetical protein
MLQGRRLLLLLLLCVRVVCLRMHVCVRSVVTETEGSFLVRGCALSSCETYKTNQRKQQQQQQKYESNSVLVSALLLPKPRVAS